MISRTASTSPAGPWTKLNPTLALDIYDGEKLIATVLADSMRVDVMEAGYGSGLNGFEYPTPEAVKDGRPHTIRVKFAGTALDLPATPKLITCTAP